MSTKTRNLLAPIVALTLVSFTVAQPAYAEDHETQGDDTVSVTWHMPAPNDGTAPTWPQTLALTDTSSEWCQVDVYRNDPEAIAAIKADGLLTYADGPEDSGVYISYEFVKCNPTVTPEPTPTPTPTPPVVTPPAPPVVAPPAPPAPPVAVAPVVVAQAPTPVQNKTVAKPQLAETGAASGALALLGGALALSGVCLVAVGRKLRRV